MAIGPPGEVLEDPVFPVTSSGLLVEVVALLELPLLPDGVLVVGWSDSVPPELLVEDFELRLVEVEAEEELEAGELDVWELTDEESVELVSVVPVSVPVSEPVSTIGVP